MTQNIQPGVRDWQWTALLQPDSTVVAVGLIADKGESPVLLIPENEKDLAMNRLARFRLRSDVTWDVHEATNPFGSESARIQAGFPGPVECERDVSPHTFGPDFIAKAISFTKGCFTGQELVGRLDSRGGNVPWRMARWRGARREPADAWMKAVGPEGPSGVTSWDEDSGWGLGFVHRTLEISSDLPEGMSWCTLA